MIYRQRAGMVKQVRNKVNVRVTKQLFYSLKRSYSEGKNNGEGNEASDLDIPTCHFNQTRHQ